MTPNPATPTARLARAAVIVLTLGVTIVLAFPR